MKDRKVNISLLAYNMLISEHTRTGDIKKAFKLFNEVNWLLEQIYSKVSSGCVTTAATIKSNSSLLLI